MIIINIKWEKFDYDIEDYGKIEKLCTSSDYGVYQLYGVHAAYGKNALLYIGEASKQTFSKRLHKRWSFIESCAFPHTLRVGRIVKSDESNDPLGWDESRWMSMIHLCEKLLIQTHIPAFNKKNNSGLSSVTNEDNNIHIFNWGDSGDLLPEVSSLRYSYKYWNYHTPLSKEN